MPRVDNRYNQKSRFQASVRAIFDLGAEILETMLITNDGVFPGSRFAAPAVQLMSHS